jgi:hypothetical protein
MGWAEASVKDPLVPLTPYTYLYSVLQGERAEGSSLLAWWVASDSMEQSENTRAVWWHLSGAALTIWLTRSWSDEQLATAAYFGLERRGQSTFDSKPAIR